MPSSTTLLGVRLARRLPARRSRACATCSRASAGRRARCARRAPSASAATARWSSISSPRTWSSTQLRALHDDGARFTLVSEERGVVDFGDPRRARRRRPDRRLAERQARPARTTRCRSRSPTGPTMADVVVRLRLRLRPRRGVARRARRGRLPQRRAARPASPDERRTARRAPRDRRGRVRRPALAARRRPTTLRRERPPRARDRVDRDLAVPGRRRRASTAMASLCPLPRGRRRGRAADRPRERRPRRVRRRRRTRSARRWPTSSRASRSSRRVRRERPGAAARGARCSDLLGARRAGRRAGSAAGGDDDAAAATSTRWPSAPSDARRSRYTAPDPAAPLPRPQVVGRDGWSRANLGLLRATLGPLDERLGRAGAGTAARRSRAA